MGHRVVHPQPAVVRVDCGAQVVAFADSTLRVYWSAPIDRSPLAGSLGGQVCDAPLPR